LTRLLKFLKGYVVIRLTGYSPERFLNLCSHHQITLWGLQSVGDSYEMCLSIRSFKKLRPLLRKTRTRMVILEKHGLPFLLHRYRNRKLFAAGAIAAGVLLYVLSLFIWNIHVDGNTGLSDQAILSYLEEEQIVHGMKKSEVHGEEIEALLREHFPDITWVSAEVKGTRLLLHIRENENAEEIALDEEEPADLIATKSGTVVNLIVRSGTPAVLNGAQVEEGDLLVASRVEVLNDDGEVADVSYVHADADLMIRYEETYDASFPMNYEKKVYTGRSRTSYYLVFGKKRLKWALPGRKFSESAQADRITSEIQAKLTENFYLPLSFGKNTEQEYEPEEAVYTKKEAAAKAKEELSLFFEKLSIKGLQIIENNVKIEISGELCRAHGTLVVEERAMQEQSPEILLPEQEDTDEERDQT
jgi:similar to stage IV sporulation protein